MCTAAAQSGYFDIYVMQSVSDPAPVRIGGLPTSAIDSSTWYIFTQPASITGRVVKVAKTGNAPTADGDQNMLALCTVSVYTDTGKFQ